MGANRLVLLKQVAGIVFPGSHRHEVTAGIYKSLVYIDLDARQKICSINTRLNTERESHQNRKNQSLPITAASIRPWVAFSFQAFEMN
jgi:hypothetical protein